VQHAGGENSTSAMRTDDLAALRKFKIKKQNVDRKASKGRRIRYTVHSKLQNFMFPVPYANQNELGFSMDSERLFTSLFQ
jgi:protein AATF/BFR2